MRLFERVIFVGSLAVIAGTAIPYGSVEFWWTSRFEIAAFVLGGLWAIEALLSGSYQSDRWLWLALPAIALIVFSLIQAIPFGRPVAVGGIDQSIRYAISADPFETRSFALRVVALALLGIILLRFTHNRERLQALVITVIGVGALSGLFGIMRQAMQKTDMGFVLPALPRGIGYGQIINRNQFAFMMEMALGLALGMIFRQRDRFERKLFYAALALPLVTALILANSRGGILTLMCELLLLALLMMTISRRQKHAGAREVPRSRRASALLKIATRGAMVAALLVVTSISVIWVGGERVTSNLSTVSDELKAEDEPARSNTRRIDIWKATWRMIKDRPLAGVGLGGYWIAVARYHDASGAYTPQQAHNDYLELLASGGAIGLLICFWFVAVLVKRLHRASKATDELRRAAWCGALVGLVGVAMHSIVDFGLHLTINGILCMALVVIGTAEIEDAHKDSRQLP